MTLWRYWPGKVVHAHRGQPCFRVDGDMLQPFHLSHVDDRRSAIFTVFQSRVQRHLGIEL